jgi:hypothetical protein
MTAGGFEPGRGGLSSIMTVVTMAFASVISPRRTQRAAKMAGSVEVWAVRSSSSGRVN